MKVLSSILPFAFLAKAALAQQDALMDRLPNCAVQCFEASLPTTSCDSTDLSCLCADTQFQTAAAGCNALNCTVIQTMSATNETNYACGLRPRDNSATMVGVTASFGAVAFVMVVLRLVDRAISSQAQLGWDDLLIGLAGFMSLIQNVPVIVAGELGFGRDMWSISPSGISNSFKWLYVTYFMYQVAEALCQASILAFYLRIMTDKKLRILSWILIGVVTGFGIGNTFSMVLQCIPIPFFWDGWKGEMEGSCNVDIRLFGFIRGAIEITLDLVILTMPLPMLAKLQMTFAKKLRIMSMFLVGFVITVVSCLRLWALVRFDQTSNPTYDNVSGVYWCVTECNLFIIVACMPAMHALAQRLLPRYFGRLASKSSGFHGSGYGSAGPGKGGSYFSHHKSGSHGKFPEGAITKSTDVAVYHTDRSASDVELVDRPSLPIRT